ncbi:MAG: FAD binding domain-containing protein [Pseudomonadota bacterium]
MMLTVETYPTLAEAAGRLGPDAAFLGGGTLVMRDANFTRPGLSRIVRTTDRGHTAIQAEGARIRIGAGVTMAGIVAHPDLRFLAPVAARVGGPAVRNMGTVGGNLFAPHPYGDLATALLALDGQARLSDGSALGLGDLLARRTHLSALVESISIARPAGDDFRFRKVARVKPKGVSVMAIAAWLPRPTGRIQGARVAYGAMAETPVRVPAVEQALEGVPLETGGIARALSVATEGLSPPDDALASAWYRREVAPVHLRRLLLNEGER